MEDGGGGGEGGLRGARVAGLVEEEEGEKIRVGL